jgi:hypothetical protein
MMQMSNGTQLFKRKQEAVAPMILWVRLGSVVCMMPSSPLNTDYVEQAHPLRTASSLTIDCCMNDADVQRDTVMKA